MSDTWVSYLTNLPVIVQGALGSALFAFALLSGQKAFRFLAARTSKFNKNRRLAYLTDETAKLHIIKGKEFSQKGAFISLLVYRSLRSFAKAFIWLSLGLLCSTVVPVFGVAGYLGALYYFFLGLNTLRAPEKVEDVPAKLAELSAERKQIKEA